MSTLLLVFLNILGSFLYLFITWRQLKDDYEHEKILRMGFLFLFLSYFLALGVYYFIAPALITSAVFIPRGLWFWGALLGVFLASLIVLKSMKMRLIDLIESQTPALFLLAAITGLSMGLVNHTGLWPLSVLLFFLAFIFYFILKANYKKFSWYRSGRVGLASLLTLGAYFLLRSAFALFMPSMLSLAGRIDAVGSFAVAFLCFYSIYNLAGN